MSRADRNNNPGNIVDSPFARRQPGYLGSDGRFARFASMNHGLNAQMTLLRSYAGEGRNTVSSILGKWAPAYENNTHAYTRSVAGDLGVAPNTPLNMSDPNTIYALSNAMYKIESGNKAGFSGARPAATTAQRRLGRNDVLPIYQRVAAKWGLGIGSGIRSEAEQRALVARGIGASATSQHLERFGGTGQDFRVGGVAKQNIDGFVNEMRSLGFEVINDGHGTGRHVHVELPKSGTLAGMNFSSGPEQQMPAPEEPQAQQKLEVAQYSPVDPMQFALFDANNVNVNAPAASDLTSQLAIPEEMLSYGQYLTSLEPSSAGTKPAVNRPFRFL